MLFDKKYILLIQFIHGCPLVAIIKFTGIRNKHISNVLKANIVLIIIVLMKNTVYYYEFQFSFFLFDFSDML